MNPAKTRAETEIKYGSLDDTGLADKIRIPGDYLKRLLIYFKKDKTPARIIRD